MWKEFASAFIDHLFPQELREEKIKEFVNLKQGRMNIMEYALKFHQSSRYAPKLVSTMRSRVRKFASHQSRDLVL